MGITFSNNTILDRKPLAACGIVHVAVLYQGSGLSKIKSKEW